MVSVELQSASDSVWASVSPESQESLGVAMQGAQQALKNVLNLARSREVALSQAIELSRLHKEAIANVKSTLTRLAAYNEEPATSLPKLHFNIEKLDHTISDAQVSFQPSLLNNL